MTDKELAAKSFSDTKEIVKNLFESLFDTLEVIDGDQTKKLTTEIEFEYNKCLEEATQKYNTIIAEYDKHIADLEKKNAELKETLKNVKCALIQDKNVAYMSFADSLFDLQVSKGGIRMTDEEIAKAWVDYHYDPAVKLTRHSLECAFIAGLKEGEEKVDKIKAQVE